MSENTYILADVPSNLTCTTSGPIQLGNIIKNPYEPILVLSPIGCDADPAYDSSFQKNFRFSEGRGSRSLSRFWIRVLQAFRISFDATNNKNHTFSYTVRNLETRTLHSMPGKEQLRARFNEPDVREILNSRWPPDLYMVSGLKIASGLSVSVEDTHDQGGGVEADVQVTPDGIVGGGLGGRVDRHRQKGYSFTGEGSVILAYELLRIRVRKKSDKETVDTRRYKPKRARLLHDDEWNEDEVMSGEDSGYSEDDTEVEMEPTGKEDFATKVQGFWITNKDGQETISDQSFQIAC